jgi:hypothetical protein
VQGIVVGAWQGQGYDTFGVTVQVRLPDGCVVYLNGMDDQEASWLKSLNCARTLKEQNLAAFEFEGNIYYRVTQNILPGTELLVYYDKSFNDPYAHTLNIKLEDDADRWIP